MIGNSADEPGFSATGRSLPGELDATEYGRIVPRSRSLLEGLAREHLDVLETVCLQSGENQIDPHSPGIALTSNSRVDTR
ncbi:hypothetical protein CP556_16915 [Natrinema sp. CBA1119]|nr:hypothetical protein CP556_16915 [Natrinema sp. CBA1119]